MADEKKKKKAPTKKELVDLIERLRKAGAQKDERIRELEAEIEKLKGPVTVAPGPAIPRGKAAKRRRADVARFMTVTRKPATPSE